MQKFKEQLLSVNWSEIEDSDDPEFSYTTFLETYKNIYNNSFPLRVVKRNPES